MAMGAKGLQVVPVQQQRPLALMALNMVYMLSISTAEGAGRVLVQELGAQLAPCAVIASG